MRRCLLPVFLAVLGLNVCFGLEESFSGAVFPPSGWKVVNADSGVREWTRLDIAWRTLPACAYCGWESYYLRNNDWLITPQCSVVSGDSFAFWYRAQDPAKRESLEVWISTSSPRLDEFTRIDALGTSSVAYERRRLDLSPYAGSRVFVGLVYRSHNQYGLMLDDVVGPAVWNPAHDAEAGRVVSPARQIRVGTTFQPSLWVHNHGQAAEWIRVSCEIPGFWKDVSGVALAPAESAQVGFPEFALWEPGRYDIVFATLLGTDQRSWNDTVRAVLDVHPFRSRGGPDSYGYVWHDSDDPAGPTYKWEEVYPEGRLLGWGDDTLMRLDLARTTRFYGQKYTMLLICTNGWLAFGPPSPGNPTPLNAPIPTSSNPNRLIAPFWDDLELRPGEGGVWHRSFGDTLLVIEWRRARRKGAPSAGLSFQVKLFDDGAVEFHYAGIECGDARYDAGAAATVGIEDETGMIGLGYLYNGSPPGNLLSAGRAIRFSAPVPGMQEDGSDHLRSTARPTIVRGVLYLPVSLVAHNSSLITSDGRKVMELTAGENDIRHLAPGVYFVRQAQAQAQAQTVRKIVVQR